MAEIQLHGKLARGRVALVDDTSLAAVAGYRWNVIDRSHGLTYVVTQVGRRTIYMHNLITGWPETDHRNHDGLDNRWENLRPATRPLNGANQLPVRGGTSRFKGVRRKSGRNRWDAQIKIDGRQQHLGSFASEAAAARAYDAAALTAWGEFAWLNFPAEGDA